MEPLKFEIDVTALRQYLKDTGRSMQALSKEIELVTEKGAFEGHTDPEIGELLKRIEKDIVRLGQVALDIRELLKGEPK